MPTQPRNTLNGADILSLLASHAQEASPYQMVPSHGGAVAPEVMAAEMKARHAAEQAALVKAKAAAKAKEAERKFESVPLEPLRLPESRASLDPVNATPLESLAIMQAKMVPVEQPKKISFDDKGNVSLTVSQNMFNEFTNMMRGYQDMDAQLRQKDAELAASQQRAQANPLLHALGLLAANIAQQPNMPGVVRAAGATAAQLRAQDDPRLIEAQRSEVLARRMGLRKESAELAIKAQNAAVNETYREGMIENMQEQRRLQAEARLMQHVKNTPAKGGYSAEFFRGVSPDISPERAQELAAQSKATGEAKQALVDIKAVHEETFSRRVYLIEKDIDRKISQGNANLTRLQEAATAKAAAKGGTTIATVSKIAKEVLNDAKAIESRIDAARSHVTNAKQKIAELAQKGGNIMATPEEKARAEAEVQQFRNEILAWESRAKQYQDQADRLRDVAGKALGIRAEILQGAPLAAAPAPVTSPAATQDTGWDPNLPRPTNVRIGSR